MKKLEKENYYSPCFERFLGEEERKWLTSLLVIKEVEQKKVE